MPIHRELRRLAALAIAVASSALHAAVYDPRLINQIEALKRLKDADLEARPAIRQALLRVLDQVRGQPAFVELVRDFKLRDQNVALLDYALANSTDASALDALRALLANDASELLKSALSNPSTAGRLIEPLGKTADNRGAPLLLSVVTDSGRSAVHRRAAVQALARSQNGARGLLQLAESGKLPTDVRLLTTTELNSVRWKSIQAEAAKVLPLPAAKGDAAMPSAAELVRQSGDPQKGATIFRRPEINCIGCHQVMGEGTDFGPNLSEIGTKLGKDALYESILDPSSGISFGFEAWAITMKNGDEAYGLLASETEEDLVLKLQGGTLQRLKKVEIANREKQTQSIMPAGLQANLTAREFVDLVEYLASMKKPATP